MQLETGVDWSGGKKGSKSVDSKIQFFRAYASSFQTPGLGLKRTFRRRVRTKRNFACDIFDGKNIQLRNVTNLCWMQANTSYQYTPFMTKYWLNCFHRHVVPNWAKYSTGSLKNRKYFYDIPFRTRMWRRQRPPMQNNLEKYTNSSNSVEFSSWKLTMAMLMTMVEPNTELGGPLTGQSWQWDW